MSRLPFAYAALVLVLFVWTYVVTGVREMGLYLALLGLNLPASLLVLPMSERLAAAAGVPVGAPAHVWGTQFAALAANSMLLVFALWVSRVVRARFLREHEHESPRGD